MQLYAFTPSFCAYFAFWRVVERATCDNNKVLS